MNPTIFARYAAACDRLLTAKGEWAQAFNEADTATIENALKTYDINFPKGLVFYRKTTTMNDGVKALIFLTRAADALEHLNLHRKNETLASGYERKANDYLTSTGEYL